MRRPHIAIVCWLLFMAFASNYKAQNSKSWNFDSDSTGTIAKGFTNEFGLWQTTADPSAPSKPNVLAQLAKSSSPEFNITLIGSTSFKDVDLTVKMKAVAGRIDQGGGLVWRARDSRNYYIARFNPLEDNFRVYSVVNGSRKELQSAALKKQEGWHTLRVTMSGDHIECSFDGQKYLDVKDSTFKDAGKIGLWTKADAQTHFDDLTASGQ
jgi:hypothetical protein